MGVYYGMNGLWVPVGGQGGAAPVDPNLLAENIKSGVTISGITGTFTNDGTARASDIASGKTAYINGKKVTGNIPTYTSSGGNWPSNTFNSLFTEWSGNWENQTSNTVTVIADANQDVLLRKDAGLHVKVPKSEFGNATTSDVASGKTFTSSAGLKVSGTRSASAGWQILSFSTISGYSSDSRISSVTVDTTNNKIVFRFSESIDDAKLLSAHCFESEAETVAIVAVPYNPDFIGETGEYAYEFWWKESSSAYKANRLNATMTINSAERCTYTASQATDFFGYGDVTDGYCGYIAVKFR